MGTTKKTKLTVFYSWQSDLPDDVNAQLIRSALGEAGIAISEKEPVMVVPDEATRDEAGSVNIVETICKKIRACDVFVCDLSKVCEANPSGGTEPRKYCNPNVAIELGYAARELGWERVILVFNEAFGTLPHDLPFNILLNRTVKYRCLNVADISNAKGHLKKVMITALKTIIRKNPKRPRELEEKPPDQIRRERDVEQLQELFFWLNLGAIDQFIDRLGGYGQLTVIGDYFHDRMYKIFISSRFHINDTRLRLRVRNFISAWCACFRYYEELDLHPNHRVLRFTMRMDMPKSAAQAKQFDYTKNQARPLRKALDSMLAYVRTNYLEVDPKKCGKEALDYYRTTEEGPPGTR